MSRLLEGSLEGPGGTRPGAILAIPGIKSHFAVTVVFVASLARLTEVETTEIKGIGPVTARILAQAGIVSVADLLHHVPHRYLESQGTTIGDAPLGTDITVVGELRTLRDRRPRRNLLIIEGVLSDETGMMTVIWFNQRHILGLQPGTWMSVTGVMERYRGSLQMRARKTHVIGPQPVFNREHQIFGVHSVIGTLKMGNIQAWIRSALRRSQPIEDPVPVEFLASHGLTSRDTAYSDIHFPTTMENAGHARRRLIYDELFRLELALALRKRRRMEESVGIAHDPPGELRGRFLAGLPYSLTAAQERVIDEIRGDLRAPHPMHRLLQGEVGSGKTVVAVAALLDGIEGGWQGAIMAPTEVLADQHFLGVTRLLADAGIAPEPFGDGARVGMSSLFDHGRPVVKVALLTGSTAVANYDHRITRQTLVDDIATGQVDLVVGTHALIQEGLDFHRLGVAVVDEQHRFGVSQRVELREKGAVAEPDLLIMTATPIPRTLSMTLYGDLDVSVLDEMPRGRTPVKTRHLHRAEEGVAWTMVREAAAAGRQCFVVCPLVEESGKVEAVSATAEHERLSAVFADLRVGLIHGQMRPGEKEEVMTGFRAGDVDVLVSTTVIEVGIDVPNATVMVVEDADRFGLSQLHQLRGRVGRGEHPGSCLLIADPGTEEAEQRLTALVGINDGFALAEEDLRIRGQGTVFGTRQSGMRDLVLADILTDLDLLLAARRDAFGLVDADPELTGHPDLVFEIRAILGDEVEWLFVS
ncbi:MAG: ATP-dependent DNA helicase RecG [Actinobacteria bacterium]|nr:ATP-dependent DNA helicase RecG [Actinomycetota bacterium]